MRIGRRVARRLRHWLADGTDTKADRFYAYLAPDLAMTRLIDGHFVYVDPLDEHVSAHLIGRGYWESWIETAILRMVKPSDRVVEVGANVGFYTLKIARAIGSNGQLDTFEASPYLAGLVARSVTFNGYADRVQVHAKAASDHAGELSFSVSRREGGSGHITVGDAVASAGREVLTVPCVKLDDALADSRPIDLFRMDAEGSEPLVLEGARSLLTRSPHIRICMEWGVAMMNQRRHVPDFIRWLRGDGFRFWLIETDGSLPELTDDALLALPLNDVVIARSHPYN